MVSKNESDLLGLTQFVDLMITCFNDTNDQLSKQNSLNQALNKLETNPDASDSWPFIATTYQMCSNLPEYIGKLGDIEMKNALQKLNVSQVLAIQYTLVGSLMRMNEWLRNLRTTPT